MIPIIILRRKVLLLAVILVAGFVVLGGCGSPDVAVPVEETPAEPAGEAAADPPGLAEDDEAPEVPAEGSGEKVFTSEELAAFDGRDGRPAYIAVDGVVYDVTAVRQWGSGAHFGFEAGADVTEALATAAPHGMTQLNQAEIVGMMAE